MISNVFVNDTVEFCYLRMVWICGSEIVSTIDLCKDVRGNGFVLLLKLPLGMKFLSACIMAYVMNLVS